jgi:hypothetical protein
MASYTMMMHGISAYMMPSSELKLVGEFQTCRHCALEHRSEQAVLAVSLSE